MDVQVGGREGGAEHVPLLWFLPGWLEGAGRLAVGTCSLQSPMLRPAASLPSADTVYQMLLILKMPSLPPPPHLQVSTHNPPRRLMATQQQAGQHGGEKASGAGVVQPAPAPETMDDDPYTSAPVQLIRVSPPCAVLPELDQQVHGTDEQPVLFKVQLAPSDHESQAVRVLLVSPLTGAELCDIDVDVGAGGTNELRWVGRAAQLPPVQCQVLREGTGQVRAPVVACPSKGQHLDPV
jgi:hypothetical protein